MVSRKAAKALRNSLGRWDADAADCKDVQDIVKICDYPDNPGNLRSMVFISACGAFLVSRKGAKALRNSLGRWDADAADCKDLQDMVKICDYPDNPGNLRSMA